MEILLKVDTLVLIYSRYKLPELKEKETKTTKTTTLLLFRNVIGMLSRQVTKVIELIYYIKMIFSKRNSIPLKEKKKKWPRQLHLQSLIECIELLENAI